MLTRELAIAEYDMDRSRILPDRLTRRGHAHYVRYADRLVQIYRQGVGRTRRELHRAAHAVFAGEEDCPARRIDGFCKLLDDGSKYARDSKGAAAKLRRQVFQMAAGSHPLVAKADQLFETEESAFKYEIAAKLGRDWPDIERSLFADVIEYHRLERFDGFDTGAALLSRYNVAQVQAALFGAESMTVWASDDFKTILRYAKLARLMHTITRDGNRGYQIKFDGPASVIRGTRRYGVSMARFLPALIACRDWRMHAAIPARRSGWLWSLDLSSQDGLTSHHPEPAEFDSQVEEAFFKQWGSEPRGGWTLERESEVLSAGQKVFVPDCVLRHEDGRLVLLEIVGFWTPEYLEAKLQTLRTFSNYRILWAVARQAGDVLEDAADHMLTFKTRLKVKDVEAWLERWASSARP